MAKFKRKQSIQSQTINTASLPDIVFMLLFFFMVVTKMKNNEVKVLITPPAASEAAVLENKQVTTYIYIGKPVRPDIYGSSVRVQLNDAFKEATEIPAWVEEEKKRIPAHQTELFTVSIKADKTIKMGILTDVKQSLREANALKIVYSANKGKSLGTK
ncbi:MAG: ExbD/TolR family protein [Chitinophagaceae bacterium]